MTSFFFAVAVVMGGIAAWQIFNWMYKDKLRDSRDVLRQESTVLLERIEKVFKVVVAEGYFSEIYDHHSKKEFLWFWNTNKKALVVTKAKVSLGFDFSKMKSRRDEKSRKLIIEELPPVEVLSIDSDYKFYDINQGLMHKFNPEDYTHILAEAKKVMHDKAMTSDLPEIATRQARLMIQQLAASMNWDVDIPKLAAPAPAVISQHQLPPQSQISSVEAADYEELPPA